MPFFELDQADLVPFRRQAIDAGVYEIEIQNLLWNNLEELTGDNLFRVAKEVTLPQGGRPDVLALDKDGRVVVIEVKRDIDRHQLAQALEYAGWARTTNLDALAGMYHGGPTSFWEDWMEFTGSATPVVVRRDPRLVLVARSFDGRTSQAMDFLLDNGLPVQILKVSFYVDSSNRRFLNVEWETEPEEARPPVMTTPGDETGDVEMLGVGAVTDFREVTLPEVAATLTTPLTLVWNRPRKGQRFEATLLPGGRIRLSDGREFRTPSGAAMAAADVVSYDGWYAWRIGEEGPTLNDLRHHLAEPSPMGLASGQDQTLDQPAGADATSVARRRGV